MALMPIGFLFLVREEVAREWKYLYSSQKVKETTGIILISQLEKSRARSRSITKIRIEYSYKVNDTPYKSSKTDGKGFDLKKLERFRVGQKVRVYYLENDPDVAFLDPRRPKTTNMFNLFVGLGLWGLGWLIIALVGFFTKN